MAQGAVTLGGRAVRPALAARGDGPRAGAGVGGPPPRPGLPRPRRAREPHRRRCLPALAGGPLGLLALGASGRRRHSRRRRSTSTIRASRRPMVTLSGGNQQKAILGRWLQREPRVCILDEPTKGVDIGARAAVHRMIRRPGRSGRRLPPDQLRPAGAAGARAPRAGAAQGPPRRRRSAAPRRTRSRILHLASTGRTVVSEGRRPLTRAARRSVAGRRRSSLVCVGFSASVGPLRRPRQPAQRAAAGLADDDRRGRHDLRHRHPRHRPLDRLDRQSRARARRASSPARDRGGACHRHDGLVYPIALAAGSASARSTRSLIERAAAQPADHHARHAHALSRTRPASHAARR